MGASDTSRSPFRREANARVDFERARLLWLIRLRWFALVGILLGAGFAASGRFPGVAWPVLLGVVAVGAVYNAILWRRHHRPRVRATARAAVSQALVDVAFLTTVLWAAGGLTSPFISFYVFHVALVGILAGPRATVLAAGVSGVAAGLLALTHILPETAVGRWDPVAPWDLLADIVALAVTAGGVAYIVNHAMRELRDREHALREARDRAALEYQLLSKTLGELEAGLEVIDVDGEVLFRNRQAGRIAPAAVGEAWLCPGDEHSCEKNVTGVCPRRVPLAQGEPGRCKFAVQIDGAERVYEMLSFPLAVEGEPEGVHRVMNLYVDRTEATLDERRLLTTERLVSLGRVAQGVAHELNTPLATIRTLATDMRAAMRSLGRDSVSREAMVEDLDESAALIQDETRRLGKITHALLAGGDLVRARVDGAVPLAAVVERARALVFAGMRSGPVVEVSGAVDELSVVADPDRLVQVLVNLLQNAVDAVQDREGARVSIRATLTAGLVEISVDDDGPGLDPEVRAHLFEPFTTTKPPGKGTGLGLYTSYMLVQAMGGRLSLDGREGGGVSATLRLPAAEDGLAPLSRLTQRAS
jgi:C4-dicarboxylate-specific signal transduction histidine kinase